MLSRITSSKVTNHALEQITTTETTFTVDQAFSDNNEVEQCLNNSNSTEIPVNKRYQPASQPLAVEIENHQVYFKMLYYLNRFVHLK